MASDLIERMKCRISDWHDEESPNDWWTQQREYAEAADEITALRATIAKLEAGLREAWIADAVDTACDGENHKTNGGDWEPRWERSRVRALLSNREPQS